MFSVPVSVSGFNWLARCHGVSTDITPWQTILNLRRCPITCNNKVDARNSQFVRHHRHLITSVQVTYRNSVRKIWNLCTGILVYNKKCHMKSFPIRQLMIRCSFTCTGRNIVCESTIANTATLYNFEDICRKSNPDRICTHPADRPSLHPARFTTGLQVHIFCLRY